MNPQPRRIPVALIQFDARPEQSDTNLSGMGRLVQQAVEAGARWIMFHESTVCDLTPDVDKHAEAVPEGESTCRMSALAGQHGCFICFGLAEKDHGRYFITQVFVGPGGFIYRYRKTWLWRDPSDDGYRNEWIRYDPGAGPELFELDSVRATCFICADGEAPRCIERARLLGPQVVFYPNNRSELPDFGVFGQRAGQIRAPMLVTNRTGSSWMHDCKGGNVIYSADGKVLACSNRQGREEILLHELEI